MSLAGKRCLILSSSWFPIGIESLERSLKKLTNEGKSKGKTFVIECIISNGLPYYNRHSFEQWLERKVSPGISVIRTARKVFEMPEVIMKNCDRPYIQKLPLRASNIFARDGYRCWYCGKEEDLTLDHILPVCRGGKSTWKNLITSCKSCNNEKGDMDIGKFCKIKNCQIPKPINVGAYPWLKQLGKNYPESWKYHLQGLNVTV